MANNDANADNTGLIVNVKYDTNVPPHVITIPSPRVMAQRAVVVVDNRPPMGSPRRTLERTRCPACTPLKKRQRDSAKLGIG